MSINIAQTNKAIEAGMAGQEPTWDNMLAAIEGAVMGVCYRENIKTNKDFVAFSALRTLVEGVQQHQSGVC